MRGNGLPKMTKTRQQEWEEAVERIGGIYARLGLPRVPKQA